MSVNKPVVTEDLKIFAKQTSDEVENAMRSDLDQTLQATDPLLREVLTHSLFNGGKRVRPMLVILASRICGKNDQALLRLAAAFEYLHVATLIHDDVIDGAAERRGRPSLVQSHGIAAAILTGDWLHARSMQLISEIAGEHALNIFCRATTGMVDGEYLQIRHTGNIAITEEQYFSIIERKTGGLIASACEIGAIYSSASEPQRRALASYGNNLGIAFQVIDDLLDYLGDQKSTGKKIGQDLVEGKITLPLIRTLAKAAPEDLSLLQNLFDDPAKREAHFPEIKNIITQNGGFDSALATAVKSVRNAVDALTIFDEKPMDSSRAMLEGLAHYVISRKK
ncbi:MAG: polyprenyl synthetase family protein [Desulfobulbaceae bacterium]|nr:polyprenyl synthetase family protein [Desulfobulbaceae bacterium]